MLLKHQCPLSLGRYTYISMSYLLVSYGIKSSSFEVCLITNKLLPLSHEFISIFILIYRFYIARFFGLNFIDV